MAMGLFVEVVEKNEKGKEVGIVRWNGSNDPGKDLPGT